MTQTAKGWIDRLAKACSPLTAEKTADMLADLPGQELDKRARLGLRIALLEHLLHAKPAAVKPVVQEPAPQPDPEPEIIDEAPAAPEPVPEEPTLPEPSEEPVPDPTPPPAPKKKRKETKFSAVSLDDAAILLSAFGGGDDSPQAESDTPQTQPLVDPPLTNAKD